MYLQAWTASSGSVHSSNEAEMTEAREIGGKMTDCQSRVIQHQNPLEHTWKSLLDAFRRSVQRISTVHGPD